MNLTFERIGQNLGIATSTAHRVYALFEQTGTVDPRSHSTLREELRSLSTHEEIYVVGLILNSPSLYLKEVCRDVGEIFHISVSQPTICRVLRRYGVTRKKIRQVALQRCESLRGAFMAQCLLFKRDTFVWVDETGSDRRNCVRKFGYALKGTRAVYQRHLSRGLRVNALAAMSSTGIMATQLTTGSVNGEFFFDFLRGTLIPLMKPFDGQSSHSVLVMDNCSVHHIQEVSDLLHQMGIHYIFLPPYSPDLNPIEEAFSYVKQYLREHDELVQSVPNPSFILQNAFDSITQQHCNSWISDSGYL